MDKQRFYVDTKGDDAEAYRQAIQFGCKLADSYPEVKRVVLLINHPQDTGWFERLYGPNVVKSLATGATFKGCKPLFKFETLKTYMDSHDHSDLVITCGLDSDDVSMIDNFHSAKFIVAIPFLPNRMEKWVKTWNPKQIRVNLQSLKE